ncbi:MAG TPA: hypothetical protein DCZ40_09560 [Lachnospiraceae bacterium]|nr:hypothetical protein [Lachnospiraceae bacterium]
MFGYVIINKGDMKFKEYDIYHAYYCGLCRKLKEKYGLPGQMALSYDMTFVIMLLTGLYEPEEMTGSSKCIAHPFEKHKTKSNEFTEYAADMNLLLSYYKCRDDWEDDRKYSSRLYAGLLEKGYKKLESKYGRKVRKIENLMQQIGKGEKEGCRDIDKMSRLFGEIMAEIVVCREDIWKENLYRLGLYLGQFIYLCDAYEDIEEDLKNGNYNPLSGIYENPDFEELCQNILTVMMSECSKEFEKLPILKNIEILRNIIYSGVWYRYEKVRAERKAGKKEQGK